MSFKKEDIRLQTLTYTTRKLFKAVYEKQNKEVEEELKTIHVPELVSGLAFFYEKIRNKVDYKEENLHRKNAIKRIFKRLVVIEGKKREENSLEISKYILHELIKAGYLSNDKIPITKIDEVQKIVLKHLKLREYIWPGFDIYLEIERIIHKEDRKIADWLNDILASEIEKTLERYEVKETMINNMYKHISSIIEFSPSLNEYEPDKNIQIYLSIHKNYMKFDEGMLSLILFKYYHGDWWDPEDEDIIEIASEIRELKKTIEKQLKHPLARQINKIVRKQIIFHTILLEMISKDPAEVYDKIKLNQKNFVSLVKISFNNKIKKERAKLWITGMYSVLFLLLTKIVSKSALIFGKEFLDINLFSKEIDYMVLTIDILFPPLLLFLIIIFSRISTKENHNLLVEGVRQITFEEIPKDKPILIKKKVKKEAYIVFLFSVFYLISFSISFGMIVSILKKLNFSSANTITFSVFLAIVIFFGFRIRRNIRELNLIEKKESLFNLLFDFLAMPIIITGKWLSKKFSQLNIFVFILDFIIETPLKAFIKIVEQWVEYVKEKKDNIVN